MLIFRPLRLIFAHFNVRVITKSDLNYFMTFSETASEELKMVSKVKSIFLQSKDAYKMLANEPFGTAFSEIYAAPDGL